MADYFSEYSHFIGAKGLPSPADTPYETPGFIRSKRSSRATTAGSTRSRDHSNSPPPLPPDATDYTDKPRDGRYSALDPRRFTPTLHASLVSEILSLRRDLDAKNSLVENLETSLASTKGDNDALSGQLSASAKEVRSAKQQVQQMESGTYEALETMVKERDTARENVQELKSKLENASKKTRRQDEDAERTQSIWESEKESWENERRQLERRIHVTEARLRTFVDEMGAQQAAGEVSNAPADDLADDATFKDSGLGNESETTSLASPKKSHKRNLSSISFRNGYRNSASTRAGETPEPFAKPGYSLADELGIDEEDEMDDEYEHHDEELDYDERVRRTMESRQGSLTGEPDGKAKRVLGLTDEPPQSPTVPNARHGGSEDSTTPQPGAEIVAPEPVARAPKVEYVDTGYQPSPPPTPPRETQVPQPLELPAKAPIVIVDSSETGVRQGAVERAISVASRVAVSPISPPETPVVDSNRWPERKQSLTPAPTYSDGSTQTEVREEAPPVEEPRKRDSLQPPPFVPSIAIHPPTSRPSSPRPYVLPPGTKNASSQANLPWNGKDAAVQTEGIRIDRRPVKLPSHLLPARAEAKIEAPKPPTPKEQPPPPPKSSRRRFGPGTAKIHTNLPSTSSLPSPPVRSPTEASSSTHSRAGSSASMRSMPLKQISLPKPVLAPAISMDKAAKDASQEENPKGPLNRSAQFGVSQQNRASRQLAEMEDEYSDSSDEEDSEVEDVAGSMPGLGRFKGLEKIQQGLDSKASSPPRRPNTADSIDAAPAPSIASSRGASQRALGGRRPPPKLNNYLNPRSRSPSFGSVASSSYSTSALPPHAIPTRSSSRVLPLQFADGPHSPTPDSGYSSRGQRSSRSQQHSRQGSLRKVQSASTMRGGARKYSPQKSRRRRRSPDLTPVQSMAFESPQQTKFPIPELPTPLQSIQAFDWGNARRPSTSSRRPETAASSIPPRDEPQAQLVDSIAATMVGEWMWKYIRRRKSFGVDRETAEDFAAQAGEDRAANGVTHGTRHKRWVWLSPYERTIMWDSKQPTSGSALLGKKGRKLNIQSVLDVPDSTPLNKKPELPTAHHRSILILTPSRALKFTAVNAERHAHWLSALTFLAESDQMQNQLPPLPLVPPIPEQHLNYNSTKRNRSPSFGRSNIRDSVRLAKGRQSHLLRSSSAQNPSVTNIADAPSVPIAEGYDYQEPEDQGADFPCIPRLYSGTARHQPQSQSQQQQSHQRKRSNTSPRLAAPFTNLRSFSSSAVPSTSYTAAGSRSTTTNPSSGRPTPSVFTSSQSAGTAGSTSRRPSITSPDQPNFFEAVGTVRMEAFVDPAVRDGVMYVPAPPLPSGKGKEPAGRNVRNGSLADRRKAGRGWVVDERGNDPFHGF